MLFRHERALAALVVVTFDDLMAAGDAAFLVEDDDGGRGDVHNPVAALPTGRLTDDFCAGT